MSKPNDVPKSDLPKLETQRYRNAVSFFHKRSRQNRFSYDFDSFLYASRCRQIRWRWRFRSTQMNATMEEKTRKLLVSTTRLTPLRSAIWAGPGRCLGLFQRMRAPFIASFSESKNGFDVFVSFPSSRRHLRAKRSYCKGNQPEVEVDGHSHKSARTTGLGVVIQYLLVNVINRSTLDNNMHQTRHNWATAIAPICSCNVQAPGSAALRVIHPILS